MTNNQTLSQKLEALKTQLSETLSEIQDLELEQSRIESENLHELDEKVKKIVETMKTRFKMYDPLNDLKVSLNVFNRTIEILSKKHKISFCIFQYSDCSDEEVAEWAKDQIDSVHFYRKINDSFDRAEILTATPYDQFSIKVDDNTDIQLSYNSYRQLVTLEIRTLFSLKDIERKLNEDSNDETDFRNISVVDENDYIFESTEMRTYLLDEMVDQIKSIKAEKLGTIE